AAAGARARHRHCAAPGLRPDRRRRARRRGRPVSAADVLALAPLGVLIAGACAVLALDLAGVYTARRGAAAWTGAAIAFAAGAIAIRLGTGAAGFSGALQRDGGAVFFV